MRVQDLEWGYRGDQQKVWSHLAVPPTPGTSGHRGGLLEQGDLSRRGDAWERQVRRHATLRQTVRPPSSTYICSYVRVVLPAVAADRPAPSAAEAAQWLYVEIYIYVATIVHANADTINNDPVYLFILRSLELAR